MKAFKLEQDWTDRALQSKGLAYQSKVLKTLIKAFKRKPLSLNENLQNRKKKH